MRTIVGVERVNVTTNVITPELKEINQARLPSNPDWVRQYPDMTNQCKTELLQIMEILQEAYPDLWDIQLSQSIYKYKLTCLNPSGYGELAPKYEEIVKIGLKPDFNIIIKFPHITISNAIRGGLTHEIFDLMVNITYRSSKVGYEFKIPPHSNYLEYTTSSSVQTYLDTREAWIMNNPQVIQEGYIIKYSESAASFKIASGLFGTRSTLTPVEYKCGYEHSHLPCTNPASMAKDIKLTYFNFCLGEGEICQVFQMLETGFNPDIFTMLLYQIDNYVRWESLDGGPHIKMENLISGTPLRTIPKLTTTEVNSYLSILKIRLGSGTQQALGIYPTLTWTTNESNQLVIEDNEELDKFIRYSDRQSDYGGDRYIYWKDGDGRYYNRTTITQSMVPTDITTKTILFRGEEIGLTILLDHNEGLTDNFIIHPALKTLIKQKLELIANYEKTRRDITRRATKAAHLRRSGTENNLHLQENIQS